MLILKFFYMVLIKNYKVKKLFNKFPEIFRGKFPEISELTTLPLMRYRLECPTNRYVFNKSKSFRFLDGAVVCSAV